MKRIVVIFVALAVLSAACGAPVEKGLASAELTQEEKREDGRALFLAIYSGFGDETLNVPATNTTSEVSDEDQQKVLATFGRVADYIEATNEGFFEKFSTDLRSGDPYAVEAALEEGSTATEHALPKAIPGSTTWQPGPVQKCTVGVAVCAIAAVAFHVAFGAINYVAGANVALAVNVWVWKNAELWDGDSATKTQRQTEAYVSELTEALARS